MTRVLVVHVFKITSDDFSVDPLGVKFNNLYYLFLCKHNLILRPAPPGRAAAQITKEKNRKKTRSKGLL